jgi:hypothetical protein
MEAEEFSSEPVTHLTRWRKRTASGAILTGIALGLQDALELPRERPAMVQPAPSEPEEDQPFELFLDRDHPEATVAVVRPWLFR